VFNTAQKIILRLVARVKTLEMQSRPFRVKIIEILQMLSKIVGTRVMECVFVVMFCGAVVAWSVQYAVAEIGKMTVFAFEQCKLQYVALNNAYIAYRTPVLQVAAPVAPPVFQMAAPVFEMAAPVAEMAAPVAAPVPQVAANSTASANSPNKIRARQERKPPAKSQIVSPDNIIVSSAPSVEINVVKQNNVEQNKVEQNIVPKEPGVDKAKGRKAKGPKAKGPIVQRRPRVKNADAVQRRPRVKNADAVKVNTAPVVEPSKTAQKKRKGSSSKNGPAKKIKK